MFIKDRNNRLKFIRFIIALIYGLIVGTLIYFLPTQSNFFENQWIMYAVFVFIFAFVHFLFELIAKKLTKIM